MSAVWPLAQGVSTSWIPIAPIKPKTKLELKVEALCRGFLARFRGKRILPGQLRSSFPRVAEPVLIAMAAEINKMATDPKTYKGKSIKTPESLLQGLVLDRLWIEMSTHGKRIDLTLVRGVLTKGSYQVVRKAFRFEISLTLDSQGCRFTKYLPRVFKMPVDGTLETKDSITRGYEVQKKMVEFFAGNKEVKIPPLPRRRNPSASTQDYNDPLETEGPWYNGDFLNATRLNDWEIPLCFDAGAPTRKITLADFLTGIIDIARTLKWLVHSLSLIHCDIQPKNFLFFVNKQKQAEGLLIDFDVARPSGKFEHEYLLLRHYVEYPYWDSTAKEGLITPLLDMHGLLVSASVCLFPDVLAICPCLKSSKLCDEDPTSCIAQEDFRNTVIEQIRKQFDFHSPEGNAKLKIFDLLARVHKDTYKVHLFLRHNSDLRNYLANGCDQEKLGVLQKIEEILLTSEERELLAKDLPPPDQLKIPFLYPIKIIKELESIHHNLLPAKKEG